jgi:hypothetical protein
MSLYKNGLIPAPIVAVNISIDNAGFQSTVTLGGFSTNKITKKNNVFDLEVPLVQ